MTVDRNVVPEEFRDHVESVKDWRQIVAWVGDLPPLPQVANRALMLIEDPDTNTHDLSELLGSDTALAARVLKIANSAMFSRQREITTISQAVVTIGFKTLKGIVMAATLQQFQRDLGGVEKLVWSNSACCAVAARYISQQLKKPYFEEAFLLGLLHDLGKLILMRQLPDDYKKIADKTQEGRTFADVEQEDLGFNHTLIGALVAKKWNFSLEICEVILHHHNPLKTVIESTSDEKTLVIQTANYAAHQLGFGHADGYPDFNEEFVQTSGLLGYSEEEVEPLLEQISEEFASQGGAFS